MWLVCGSFLACAGIKIGALLVMVIVYAKKSFPIRYIAVLTVRFTDCIIMVIDVVVLSVRLCGNTLDDRLSIASACASWLGGAVGRLPPGEAARAGAQATSCLWGRARGAGVRGRGGRRLGAAIRSSWEWRCFQT